MRLTAARVPLAAIGMLAALAFVPACSGTPSAPQTTAPATSTPQTKHGAFGECLREHGVTQPPGPAPGPAPDQGTPPPPAGVDQKTWNDAMQACGSLAPSPPGPSG